MTPSLKNSLIIKKDAKMRFEVRIEVYKVTESQRNEYNSYILYSLATI